MTRIKDAIGWVLLMITIFIAWLVFPDTPIENKEIELDCTEDYY